MMSCMARGFASLSMIATLGLSLAAAAPAAAQFRATGPTVVGTKIADGQAYATVVVLKHQSNPANNGRVLLAFEGNGWDGIPIWQSNDNGDSWSFVGNAQDPA
jgi:hypothetical protein